jgi:ABC-type lipoprotein export system ATPase subunit
MLATKAELSDDDFAALEECLMCEAGLGEAAGQSETLFEAAHLKSKAAADVRLLGVTKLDNINRLDGNGLTFAPDGLSIVYGENGSGKTGFIRVLRKACRSRIEKQQDLEILANVYGGGGGTASARFTISDGGKEDNVDWTDGAAPDRRLSALSVFDTRSAQLYVDEGNKLRFLPADLDLPFRLNDVIQRVEARLAPELAAVHALLNAHVVPFEAAERTSKPRTFVTGLSAEALDEAIEEACLFTDELQTELDGLVIALGAGLERIAELKRTAAADRTLAQRVNGLGTVLGPVQRTELHTAWATTVDARQAHEASKALIDGKDPLPGVGSEVWAKLWLAAQDFATAADGHHHFPGDGPRGSSSDPLCPLCQQSTAGAAERLARFHEFMSSTTATALSAAEQKLSDARAKIVGAVATATEAEIILIGSIRGLAADLASRVEAKFSAAEIARTAWLAFTGVGDLAAGLEDEGLGAALLEAAEKADALAKTASEAQDEAARAKLVERRNGLEDQRCLSACAKVLKDRRDALKRLKGLKSAEASCRRNEVTRQANGWVDIHLTKAAKAVFKDHLQRFRLQHLNVELERQSTSVGTGYKNTIQGGKGFKRVSDVLSEGEQRALSLAAFFTEAELERPGGTLIVDDPVSSLDRYRSAAVAAQLVQEAKSRQVIVFTHDLMFLEELGEAAKHVDIEPSIARVFSTAKKAGLLDPSGSSWKGQNVKQRTGFLKTKLAELKALETTSKTDYEVAAKAFYGRLRDAYERLVEERLFHNVVTRFSREVRTRELRYVTVPDTIAKRFHVAFSKASLHSHDPSRTSDVTSPDSAEISADLDEMTGLLQAIEAAQKDAEAARPEMAP